MAGIKKNRFVYGLRQYISNYGPSPKLKASSLLEVVIALVIILLMFGIAMMIYVNVTASSYHGVKFKTDYLLEEVAAKMIADGNLENGKVEIGGLTIYKDCKPYKKSEDLMEIRLEAVNEQGSLLGRYRRIVQITEDE